MVRAAPSAVLVHLLVFLNCFLAVRGDDDDEDDDDEVGWGMYALILFAAMVVVVMYSWMGWTLYQARRRGVEEKLARARASARLDPRSARAQGIKEGKKRA